MRDGISNHLSVGNPFMYDYTIFISHDIFQPANDNSKMRKKEKGDKRREEKKGKNDHLHARKNS